MTEVVREYPHLRILWVEELAAIHMQWLAPVGGAPFRDGLDDGLAALVERGARHWLADLKQLGVINRSDEAWLNEDWFPRAVDAGMRWLAIVNPESSLSTISIREIMQGVSAKKLIDSDLLVTHSFEDLRDALAWLRECA